MLGCGVASCSELDGARPVELDGAALFLWPRLNILGQGGGRLSRRRQIRWRDRFGIACLGVDQKLDKTGQPSGPRLLPETASALLSPFLLPDKRSPLA